MGQLLVMMMTMISPSGREVPPTESLRRRAKVLLPKFRLKTTALHPENPPLIFLGQNDLYTRRGAPEVGRGGHNPPGRAWGPWHAQVGCAHLVGPLWQLFHPIILKYSVKNLREVLTHLELCRIGGLTQLFQVQNSHVYYATLFLQTCVGPPSAEFCRTITIFPHVDDLRFINP